MATTCAWKALAMESSGSPPLKSPATTMEFSDKLVHEDFDDLAWLSRSQVLLGQVRATELVRAIVIWTLVSTRREDVALAHLNAALPDVVHLDGRASGATGPMARRVSCLGPGSRAGEGSITGAGSPRYN